MKKRNEATKEPYIISIPIFEGVDFMDIAAPREIFDWLNHDDTFKREVQIYYVGQGKAFTTNNGVRIIVEAQFTDEHVQHPNLIWVPGGRPDTLGRIIGEQNSSFTNYVKRAGAKAEWVCSVCEGAVLLANTGLLDHYEATTHWNFVNCIAHNYKKVNLVPGNPRYVKSGNRVTGGGISSGLDEALFLVELIAGTASAIKIQQTMQYYPRPPVESTIPEPGACPVPGLHK